MHHRVPPAQHRYAAGRDVPCSRGIMRNVSFDNIEYVDAWSRTTQYGDDKPVHPDALPESYVDVGRWAEYKCEAISRPGCIGPQSLTVRFDAGLWNKYN